MSRQDSCPFCSATTLSVHEAERRIRADDGADLPYTASYSRCERCGEEFYTVAQTKAASRAAAGALRKHAGLLTPAEIVALRQRYAVTQVQLERILKLGKKSVVRWEAGTVCQSRAADQLLREISASPSLFERLASEVGISLRKRVAPEPSWGEFVTTHFNTSSVIIQASTMLPARSDTLPNAVPSAIDWSALFRVPETLSPVDPTATRGNEEHQTGSELIGMAA